MLVCVALTLVHDDAPLQVVCGQAAVLRRGEAVEGVHAGNWMRVLVAPVGGKGGGSGEQAQGRVGSSEEDSRIATAAALAEAIK